LIASFVAPSLLRRCDCFDDDDDDDHDHDHGDDDYYSSGSNSFYSRRSPSGDSSTNQWHRMSMHSASIFGAEGTNIFKFGWFGT